MTLLERLSRVVGARRTSPVVSRKQFELSRPSLDAYSLMSRLLGVEDTGQPTQRWIETRLRGLFSRLLIMRADAITAAILGSHSAPGFRVVRRTSEDEVEDVETDHPWRRLLYYPSHARDRYELWNWAAQIRDTQGVATFRVNRDERGVPVELVEVYPAFGVVRPVGDGFGGIDHYKFIRNDGQVFDWESRDVFRIRRPSIVSPYDNWSILEAAVFQLDKQLYADVYERDTLREGRVPPVYLSSDQDLTSNQMKRYGEEFQDAYMRAGSHTEAGMPVVGAGLSIETVAMKAADMQMIESQQLRDTHIFWISGVHRGLLDENATEANAKAGQFVFAKYAIQPEVIAIAASMTFSFRMLFGAEDSSLEIIAPDVTPTDETTESKNDALLVKTGIMSLNDAKRKRGLDEVDGGDEPLVPIAMQSLSSVLVSPPTVDGGDDDDGDGDDDGVGGAPEADELDDKSVVRRSLLRVAVWRIVELKKRDLERPLVRDLRALFERQLEQVLEDAFVTPPQSRAVHADDLADVLTETYTARELVSDIDDILDLDLWIAETRNLLGAHVARIAEAGWKAALNFAKADDIPFDLNDALIEEAILSVNNKSRDIVLHSNERLADLLQSAQEEGQSDSEIAKSIRELFSGMSAARSTAIAETTGTTSYETGQHAAYQRAGITEHEWLSVRDDRVREPHAEADGQRVPLGASFDVGGESLRFPGDPAGSAANVIRCRCTVLPVT